MSFLEMLRGLESSSSSSFIDSNSSFEFLLRMQQNQKHPEIECGIQALELESCITNDVSEPHSPIKSKCKDPHQPQSSSCRELEVVSSECNGETKSPEKCRGGNRSSRAKGKPQESNKAGPAGSTCERRKRKRTRPPSNTKEEVESQRMTHIAVERNRRRQMNDHLNTLRSLMPTSFVRRGEQASIIGGAVDFIKELERLLQLLEAWKRMKKSGNDDESMEEEEGRRDDDIGEGGEMKAEHKSVADIQVLVVEKRHVNLKMLLPRRMGGQLVRAISALEDLRMTILHLNITSSQRSVLYSFNLKMEDECNLGSADEISTAVHQTFSGASSTVRKWSPFLSVYVILPFTVGLNVREVGMATGWPERKMETVQRRKRQIHSQSQMEDYNPPKRRRSF
ncbi:transcription factor bHLH57-like [Telopea speciosissima]|uniref:transcription factor bHLH57-like n=1 Tax=Telopea speciosissima TaxID=54955 RepID=UPI001CC76004|nr:transcription factor bHLH57-like [Telopea speciosissima]